MCASPTCGRLVEKQPGKRSRPSKYCSQRCGHAHRQARLRERASDSINARRRELYQLNRDRVISAVAARRAKAPGNIYPLRRLVWSRDGGVCQICQEPADPSNWHMDHVVPLALGGPHTLDNLQVAHAVCNQRKGASSGPKP